MMTSTNQAGEESAAALPAPVSASVQPSSHLINILHGKLRDPGIVPAFEFQQRHHNHRVRRLNDEGLVIRPRWILLKQQQQHVDEKCGADEAAEDGSSQRNNTTKTKDCYYTHNGATSKQQYNALPKRNYIDLRMEQNRRFADDQCLQCQRIMSSKEGGGDSSSRNNNDIDWRQKHPADYTAIQSLINEGLAACPNHQGLLNARRECNGWNERSRISPHHAASKSIPAMTIAAKNPASVSATTSRNGSNNRNESTILPPNPNFHLQNRKGAEGRAQAAMRDALLERSFLLGDARTIGKKKDDVGKKYPLLAAADDEPGGHAIGREAGGGNSVADGGQSKTERDANNNESMSSDSSIEDDSRSRRRRKKRSKHHRKHDKRHKKGRKKRRHHRKRDDPREYSSHRRSSRSESRSVSPSMRSLEDGSILSSQSQDHSSDRKRKHHYRSKDRKERGGKKKCRHKKKSRSSKRHDSDDEDEKDDGDINQQPYSEDKNKSMEV